MRGTPHAVRTNGMHDTSAVSLVEILVVISALAIIGLISLPVFRSVLDGSRQQTALRNLNFLNGAVQSFNNANWELVLTASPDISDETAIFNSLVYRDATNPAAGSPYLPANFQLVTSTSTSDYRARWTGRLFEMLPPGTSGTGLNLLNMSGTPRTATATNTPVPPSR